MKHYALFFFIFIFLFSCKQNKSNNIHFIDTAKNVNTRIKNLPYSEVDSSICTVILLDTIIKDLNIKISYISEDRLVMESIVDNIKSFDTISCPLYSINRDGLILYDSDRNTFSYNNFFWFENGGYGIFCMHIPYRESIKIYSLLIDNKKQLIFGNNVGLNPYYCFIDIKKSQLFIHTGLPQISFEMATDSGDVDIYYRNFYQYNISKKGFELEKTITITNSCIGENLYYSVDEDIQKTVDFYLQARKLRKSCIILPPSTLPKIEPLQERQ